MSKNLEKLKYFFLPCVFILIQWVLFTKYFHKEIKQLFSKVFFFFQIPQLGPLVRILNLNKH
jgi:hypothetical protein